MMDHEIVGTGTKPNEFGREMECVWFRVPGGEVQQILYGGIEPESPDEVVQWYLQREEERKRARANLPDTIDTFGMWAKMDMSDLTWEELKQAYRDHMDELGYDVDAQMVAHRRQPATG